MGSEGYASLDDVVEIGIMRLNSSVRNLSFNQEIVDPRICFQSSRPNRPEFCGPPVNLPPSMFASVGNGVLMSLEAVDMDDGEREVKNKKGVSRLVLVILEEVKVNDKGVSLRCSKKVETKGKTAGRYEDNNEELSDGKYKVGLIGMSKESAYTMKIKNVRKNKNEEGSYKIINPDVIEMTLDNVDSDEDVNAKLIVESRRVKVDSGLHGFTGKVNLLASGIKIRAEMNETDDGKYELSTDSIKGAKKLDEMIKVGTGELVIVPLFRSMPGQFFINT